MRVWRDLAEVPATLGRSAVTVGNFDGVHRGHAVVIGRTVRAAEERGADAVVAVTFDPHPMQVLRPDHAPRQLTTIEERADLLAALGVDHVLALPFTRELASWSPERFVDDVLVRPLGARAVVVGSNFRFGSRAAGDTALLSELGAARDYDTVVVELAEAAQDVCSSTAVRERLATGDVAGAADVLGRPVRVRGVVERGDRRGRELGYPTANIAAGGMAPADGVYAAWLRVLDGGPGTEAGPLPAATSVGTNPTFEGERERRVESYVLDRDDLDLYEREVEVEFVDLVRGMRRFDGVEELLEAMADDVRTARERLG